jgi:O-antigen ligase
MWVGVATHKNTLAQLCLFAGIVLFLDVIRTWRNNRQVLRVPLLKVRVDILCGAMLVYLLNGGGGHSKSTTAILVIVFACGLILLLERQHRRGQQIVPTRLIVGLLLSALAVHFGLELALDDSLYVVVAESQGKDPTLTGRTELWEDLLIMGQRHPLFGTGYGGFWTHENCAELKQRHFWGPHQAHNGYIEIWLQLGPVGLLLFALVVGQALRGLAPLFRQDFELGRFRLVVLLITLLHNYSEAGFPRPTHLVWFVFLLVVINVQPVQVRAAEKAPSPADAAGYLWRHKQGSVRPRWSPSMPRTMHSRNLKLTPWLQGGQKL